MDRLHDANSTAVLFTFSLPASPPSASAHPHDPRELPATVYHLLGVPADTIVYDQTTGRTR